MRYYEVLIGDAQFHGSEPLTYAWHDDLAIGTVVRVSLRSRSVLGIIAKQSTAPSFATKPLAAVLNETPLPSEALRLIQWMSDYYPSGMGSVVRQFLPPLVTSPHSEKSYAYHPKHIQAVTLDPLTKEQASAVQSIKDPGSYLLHGITGSGKTRVYLELARQNLEAGRSTLLLTPEIGLTEHLVQAMSSLPCNTYVLHSRLTSAARRDIWYEMLSATKPIIVVGPRSALFSPLKDIGLVIMDEAHDQAYKSDSPPHYRSERVAGFLAQLHKAQFIAGTATPNVEDVYVFSSKNLPVITLNTLARTNDHQSTISIVDMRDKANFGQSRILSQSLIIAVKNALAAQEQALLFLNRRGTASAVLCANCGWRASCTHCDLPLTYHGDQHLLQCHVCGRKSKLPSACPECGQTEILLKTIGTKAVVEEAQRLFPTARIKRFDTDSAKADHIESQLNNLRAGEVDIIIGTQMVTKGLDLPRLSVVGVLNADASLLLPDYSANERTYQLLTQVIGRVGRGHRASEVILQTYSPENPTVLAATTQDWNTFYESEITERRAYNFPPFCYVLKLSCLRATQKGAEEQAHKLHRLLSNRYKNVQLEGPAPAFHPKESGKFKWQLTVKASSRTALVAIAKSLPSGWRFDIDPIDLL